MATWTFAKVNDWLENRANADVDMDADTFAIALSNTAPSAETSDPTADGNGVLSNVTQIAYTNYTDSLTTDRVLEGVTSSQTGGTYTFDAANFTITASGGAIATFRYLYVYDDTATSPADPLIGVWDAGAAVDLADGDKLNVNVNASGLITET